MFGWEYPPYKSGGLGTACYGLTKGLSRKNTDIIFVLPQTAGDVSSEYARILVANKLKNIKFLGINSPLRPYITSQSYSDIKNSSFRKEDPYGENLFQEVHRYAEEAKLIAAEENFDLIHCHDWMTYPAGIAAKDISGKKLIVHLHATEFDRTGGNGCNQQIYEVEKSGFEAADRIIAVSEYAKGMIVKHYGIKPDKIRVVHNGVEQDCPGTKEINIGKEKKVLFLGRITLQKGPEYFVYAAKHVLEKRKDVKFVMAGSGDMLGRMIDLAFDLGIADHFIFTGFIKDGTDSLYSSADVYVLTSVSEPFGITPLEALKNGTPVIITKQAGVSEVLSHALKVDFWDTREIANKTLAVLDYKSLHDELSENGKKQLGDLTWKKSAEKVLQVYREVA